MENNKVLICKNDKFKLYSHYPKCKILKIQKHKYGFTLRFWRNNNTYERCIDFCSFYGILNYKNELNYTTNGAKKGVKTDTCFNSNVTIGKFLISYVNWCYNKKLQINNL